MVALNNISWRTEVFNSKQLHIYFHGTDNSFPENDIIIFSINVYVISEDDHIPLWFIFMDHGTVFLKIILYGGQKFQIITNDLGTIFPLHSNN